MVHNVKLPLTRQSCLLLIAYHFYQVTSTVKRKEENRIEMDNIRCRMTDLICDEYYIVYIFYSVDKVFEST